MPVSLASTMKKTWALSVLVLLAPLVAPLLARADDNLFNP